MHRLPLLLLAVLPQSLRAQTTNAYNRIEFGNWWITDREDTFPNYTTAAGNVAGDGLFKVFPAEIFERGENHKISGYQIALSIDDAYTGTFPVEVELPAVQLYRTQLATLAGGTYEVPDLAQPVGLRFPLVPTFVRFDSDVALVIEVRFPRPQDLVQVAPVVGSNRRGLAMMVLGKPGDRRAATVPGVVLQSSFAERHFAPGRASYSGSFDAATSTMRMFGTAGMPSATGELYFGLRFDNPTLQLAGPSAGGVANDPRRFETQLGPGAYATDLASRLVAGHVRFLVQGEQFDPRGGAPTHLAFPFVVALGASGPTTTLVHANVALRIDPASIGLASLLVNAGFGGALDRIPAATTVGFDVDQLGAWISPPLAVPRNAALVGAALWIQALVTTTSLGVVAGTNVVRLTL